MAQQAYAAVTLRLTQWIEPALRPEVAARLAAATPRRITRLIGLALPMALAARRDALSITDIATVALLLDSAKEPEPPPIGFRPARCRPDDAA